MKFWILPVLLLSATPALNAQEPHVGFWLNLLFPTGGFRNTTYPASNASVLTPQNEGYDIGFGAQFTVSQPLDQKVAIRLNLNAQSTSGNNTAAGYDRINLQHQLFSIGGEMQLFLDNAFLHRGTYLLGGVCADFERFDRSFGTPNYDYTEITRKSRMGGTLGVGHSFGYDLGRFSIEAVYHKTLTGNDTARFEPPSTDFLKLTFGWVF